MSLPTVAVRLRVVGRVQGVGFRWFVLKRARELEVTGWVRNLPDGSVEIVAKGRADDVEALSAAASAGPRFAHVDNVEKSNLPVDVVHHNSFEVK